MTPTFNKVSSSEKSTQHETLRIGARKQTSDQSTDTMLASHWSALLLFTASVVAAPTNALFGLGFALSVFASLSWCTWRTRVFPIFVITVVQGVVFIWTLPKAVGRLVVVSILMGGATTFADNALTKKRKGWFPVTTKRTVTHGILMMFAQVLRALSLVSIPIGVLDAHYGYAPLLIDVPCTLFGIALFLHEVLDSEEFALICGDEWLRERWMHLLLMSIVVFSVLLWPYVLGISTFPPVVQSLVSTMCGLATILYPMFIAVLSSNTNDL